MRRIYDISEPLEPATAVFPGDTQFSRRDVMRMADGMSCNVSTIEMSLHCGSHADAPRHYREAAAHAGEYPLEVYWGPCVLLEVGRVGRPPLVDPASLDTAQLAGAQRVLLRTDPQHDHTRFDPEFCALGPDAARALADAGVRLVGIDSQSMDHPTSKDLPSHNILLDAGICLLENLDLSAVPAGSYELCALPLRIPGADAAPVRAALRTQP